MRTPTEKDRQLAEWYLQEALRELKVNEYYRVKQLCSRVKILLKRKEGET